VWDSNYAGLDWPKKRTVVLKVEAPNHPYYWRATTLDAFVGNNWREDLHSTQPRPVTPALRRSLVRQRVTVDALIDRHLVGAERPVAYDARDISSVSHANDGIGLVVPGADRGKTYTVWSSVQRPTPDQLARSKPEYPMPIYVDRNVKVPPFGQPGRDSVVRGVLSADPTLYT